MSLTDPLCEKIALVTGSQPQHPGRASALALANAGAHVIAVGRTEGGLTGELDDEIRAATGEPATLVPLDIADGDSLDGLGLALHQRFGRIDVLVHAAAILGPMTPVAHIEPKHWDRVVAVNLTASYRLIRTTEPLLRASEAGRAIFLTTGRVAQPKAFWGPYGVTKAGMEHMVRTWADELEQTKVRAVLLEPRPHAHQDARGGHAGRGPSHPARPLRDRAADRGAGAGRPRPAPR